MATQKQMPDPKAGSMGNQGSQTGQKNEPRRDEGSHPQDQSGKKEQSGGHKDEGAGKQDFDKEDLSRKSDPTRQTNEPHGGKQPMEKEENKECCPEEGKEKQGQQAHPARTGK